MYHLDLVTDDHPHKDLSMHREKRFSRWLSMIFINSDPNRYSNYCCFSSMNFVEFDSERPRPILRRLWRAASADSGSTKCQASSVHWPSACEKQTENVFNLEKKNDERFWIKWPLFLHLFDDEGDAPPEAEAWSWFGCCCNGEFDTAVSSCWPCLALLMSCNWVVSLSWNCCNAS